MSAKAKRAEFAQSALEFTEQNRGSFVFLADPDTDVMFFAFRGIQVPVRFTQPDGSRMHIVRDALRYENGDDRKAIDQFLLVVDSALVNIAKAIYNRRRDAKLSKLKDVALEFVGRPVDEMHTIEGMKSPFQVKTTPGDEGTHLESQV